MLLMLINTLLKRDCFHYKLTEIYKLEEVKDRPDKIQINQEVLCLFRIIFNKIKLKLESLHLLREQFNKGYIHHLKS